jgi:stage III sporulation protein AB
LLEKMSAQIRYNASPLGDLFGTLSKDGGEFINTVGACHGTDGQINWRTAWNAAVSGFSEFNDGDKELLLTVGNSLGSSDTAGQVNMLGLHRELLTVRCGEAAETAANKGAVYRSVGLLTGLGMAIMVI